MDDNGIQMQAQDGNLDTSENTPKTISITPLAGVTQPDHFRTSSIFLIALVKVPAITKGAT